MILSHEITYLVQSKSKKDQCKFKQRQQRSSTYFEATAAPKMSNFVGFLIVFITCLSRVPRLPAVYLQDASNVKAMQSSQLESQTSGIDQTMTAEQAPTVAMLLSGRTCMRCCHAAVDMQALTHREGMLLMSQQPAGEQRAAQRAFTPFTVSMDLRTALFEVACLAPHL